MADQWPLFIAIYALVLVSALLQRITGLGFAMIMAPFLVVMVGPHAGVMLTNALSFLAPMLMIVSVWRQVDWKRLAVIAPVALATMPIFGLISSSLDRGPLYIIVGTLVLIALSASVILERVQISADGPVIRAAAGLGTGGGVVLAGVGGPAMAAYAVLSRWNVTSFAATLQPLWALMAVGGFTTNYLFNGHQLPALPWYFWVLSVPVILLGMWLGLTLRHRVSESAVRTIVIGIAFLGGILSVATGIAAW